MKPVRWDVRISAKCPNGHAFTIETSVDFAVEVPDHAQAAPAMISLPTRCPRCEPRLRLVTSDEGS